MGCSNSRPTTAEQDGRPAAEAGNPLLPEFLHVDDAFDEGDGTGVMSPNDSSHGSSVKPEAIFPELPDVPMSSGWGGEGDRSARSATHPTKSPTGLTTSCTTTEDGSSDSSWGSSMNGSTTSIALLPPIDLPPGYLEKRRASIEPLERKGTGIPRRDTDATTTLPIHWASRFLPREVGCLHDLHYNGGFASPTEPFAIDPPSRRRQLMADEILNRTKDPAGRGLAWPHPRRGSDGCVLLLPLGCIKNEPPRISVASFSASTSLASSSVSRTMLRRHLQAVRKKLVKVRKELADESFPLETSSLIVEECIDATVDAGLMQIAATLIMLHGILSDAKLLLSSPTEFVECAQQSVGAHYLDEVFAIVESEGRDADSIDAMKQGLLCFFREDAAYCFMMARHILNERLALLGTSA